MIRYVNQMGEPVVERDVLSTDPSRGEVIKVLELLLNHLKLEAVETNATKHGATEIILREIEPGFVWPRPFETDDKGDFP